MSLNRRGTLKMLASTTLLGSVPTTQAAERAEFSGDTLKSQISNLKFDLGLPTPDTVIKLYDTMDFQRACVCYLWATPIVGIESARQMLVDNASARSGDLVLVAGYRDVSMMLGSNVTTPYVFAYFDLSDTPIVVKYPQGVTAGSFVDWWDRPLTDLGVNGPDGGKGASYVLLGPNHDVPRDVPASAHVLRSRTQKVLMFCRGLDAELSKVEAVFSTTRVYPYGRDPTPEPTRLLRFRKEGKLTSMTHPPGIVYWHRLANALHGEPIEDRDRFFAAMLLPLGIATNRTFNPNSRQRDILEIAATLGEATAKATAFNKRIAGMRYRDDTHWEYLIPQSYVNEQDVPKGTLFEERTAFFYEVTGTSEAVLSKTPGVGSGYLTAYYDKHGAAFDGGRVYHLHVPGNVPAKLFWSITLYDTETRCLIQNAQRVVDRSSRQELLKNPDGSIDIVMGPTAPVGVEKNWIPTTPGRSWYTYFRLFGPLDPYFKRTWMLPDIELSKD
ncbi:DUF1214 domain-containing protein [Paraburkholderia terricola]|uniref:DUF1254 domain-containing protein n=1 Tax=Paraburkholderia terricola TaxID=169427 RepID=A0ABU1M2I8_9BURK|nr:DUF1214 domain-containing protein [Paraburkholderia terricola]MDR6413233.1 hypothetical protein [Paraburkholderia terricola]MDR6484833.1 hypothetical protein [Paraburkholderia terricola]